jgi:hypothetical protein
MIVACFMGTGSFLISHFVAETEKKMQFLDEESNYIRHH